MGTPCASDAQEPPMSKMDPVGSTLKKTVLVHLVALAGLACGAVAGATVTRDAAAGGAVPAVHDAGPLDGEEPSACMLPGVRKPGSDPCGA
jgi:hypothetical protein